MNSNSENTKKEKSNARQAGVCTSIGVASTTLLGMVTAKSFGDLPIEVTYAGGGATAYGLLYTIQNVVEFNFKHATEFTKGFIATPLLATSIYMASENINFSSLSNEQDKDSNIIIIEQKPLKLISDTNDEKEPSP